MSSIDSTGALPMEQRRFQALYGPAEHVVWLLMICVWIHLDEDLAGGADDRPGRRTGDIATGAQRGA